MTNRWRFDRETTFERICSVCGGTHKTKAILNVKGNMKCTTCILKDSEKDLALDSLSGSFTFTDGEVSNDDYNSYLDEAEKELTKEGI